MPSSPILSALISGRGLASIITEHHLSADDLHTLLSTPGIPDRLLAARALARLDDEFRTLAARARATDHLLHLIDTSDDTAEHRIESRRAATAILKGPLAFVRPPPASMNPDRKGGARSPMADIADWADPDDQDDADLDEYTEEPEAQSPPGPATAGSGVGGSATTESPGAPGVSAPAPSPGSPPIQHPQSQSQNPLQLPPDRSPAQLVSHQLTLIRAIQKPTLTPRDITAAIDYHGLAFPNRYYGDLGLAFRNRLENNPILEVSGAQVTQDPAVIHDTTPPTAGFRVSIKHPDGRSASCLFHLIRESTFFPDPASPHAWHTQSITRDDSG